MLFQEIFGIYCENDVRCKHTALTECTVPYAESGGIYSYHQASNDQDSFYVSLLKFVVQSLFYSSNVHGSIEELLE